MDYVGTDGGKDVAAAITPGGYPQPAAGAHAFAHRPCGHQNGGRPGATAVVPSFHRPYHYDDSYIYQAVTSKPARQPGAFPVKRHRKTAPPGGHSRGGAAAAGAQGTAHTNGRGQGLRGAGPLTSRGSATQRRA